MNKECDSVVDGMEDDVAVAAAAAAAVAGEPSGVMGGDVETDGVVPTGPSTTGDVMTEGIEGGEASAESLAEAAVAAATAAAADNDDDDDDANDASGMNKWSKNGFGAPVAKQTGKFSKDESEIVRKSIEEYCAAKAISVARLCSECDHKAELKGAWMEIAKRLPHRSVQSVYRHGIRQCHPFKRGAWNEQECAMLNDLVTRLGKKWSAIQAKLNRSADSCRDKYREMSEDFVKGRWKEAETENLKKLIREHLHVDPSISMKDLGKLVEEQNIQVPWSAISKRMGKRSRLSCFKKWQKMTGLFSPADEYKRSDATPTTMEGKASELIAECEARELKRRKTETGAVAVTAGGDDATKDAHDGFHAAASAGQAAAMAAAAAAATQEGDYEEYKMAAETVEAVELPDTGALGGSTVV